MAGENSLYRAKIPAIADTQTRPIWSVMIPTYDCAEYLRRTLRSVLQQDLGSEVMQIEVIDDCSTQDDPEAVVNELGKGRVSFYRQPQNVGYIKNFETCLLRSKGKLVHLLHGDDCVRSSFYQKMQSAFEKNPHLGAAFCRSIYIDEYGHWQSLSPLERNESGILESWLEKIASGQRLTTPSIVVQREVYENLGGFDRRFSCAGEDWEMWVRIATSYPVWFEVEPLALYRVKRAGSLTGESTHKGRLVQDMRLATDIIESYLSTYLPQKTANKLIQQARNTYANWAVETSREMYIHGYFKNAIFQLNEAVKCNFSVRTFYQVINLFLWQGLYLRTFNLLINARQIKP
ncbi:MAG: glycosyltransferase [Rivularia sp. (in: cyanobacteria)]